MKQSVLFIQESMDGGGAEHVLVSILKHLPADKYDITLLLIFNTGRLLDAIPDNVKVKYLVRDNTSRYTRLVYHTKYTRNLVQRHLADTGVLHREFLCAGAAVFAGDPRLLPVCRPEKATG